MEPRYCRGFSVPRPLGLPLIPKSDISFFDDSELTHNGAKVGPSVEERTFNPRGNHGDSYHRGE